MHAVHAGIIRSVSFTRGWGRAGGKTRAIRRLKDFFLIKKTGRYLGGKKT